jgi:hypothetical protein
MQNIWLKLNFGVGLLVAILVAGAIARGTLADGGALEPPGAPAPGMKSLQEVEPRTPISSIPYTISQSGSYYLTQNVTANAAYDGITVSASDVTIDLNGYVLSGGGSGIYGIKATGGTDRLTVHRGTISNWLADGIAHYGQGGRFEELKLVSTQYGLNVFSTSIVRNVVATNNLIGIFVWGNGSSIEANVLASNSVGGINVTGGYNRVESNNAVANSIGIEVSGSNNAVVRNTATGNAQEFVIGGGNFAPIETSPAVTDPWANVIY